MRRMPECLGRLVKTAPTARDDRGISGKESIVPHRSRTEPFDVVRVAALYSAGLAVIISDLDLDPPGPSIRYVNRMFEDMTGVARAEVLGKSPRILQGPTTDPEVLCRLKTSLQADDYFCGETINYRKDGEPYAVRWIITPIMGVHGLPSHWIALDRKSVVSGKSVSVRVDLGCRRFIQKKKNT